MSRMITATGMALLSIGVVATVQAQPVSSAGQVVLDTNTTPADTAAAARRKGPKEKRKEATTRVANPSTPGVPAADVPIAPIDAPDAARTGRPKVKVKEATNDSAASPPVTTEPVAQPTERRRTGRPKERDDDVRTHTKRSPATTPSRGSNLLLPALGGAAAIAAIVAATSGNDRPTSP